MKRRLSYLVLVAAGLAAAGWYGYSVHRGPTGPGFEVAASPAARARGSALPAPANAAQPADPGPRSAPGAPGSGGAQPGGDRGGAGSGGRARPQGPVEVEVGKVEAVTISEDVTAVGTLRANESVMLRPEVAGRIAQINFADGARVTRGRLLIALDAAVTAAELEQARAELSLAQANFQRTSDLFQKNFVSGRAKDEAAATLKVLEAKLQLAQARLAKHELRAPFDGVTGLRNVSVGDYVKEGADLLVIEDISSMKVDLRLPERYFSQLRRGQAIQLAVDSFPGRTFTATLDAIDAQVDVNGRSLVVRGRLGNVDGALRSGMYARARVVLGQRPDALMIPEEAVLPQGRDQYVYRVDGGRAVRTRIETGIRRNAKVEVVSGLSAGDLVVTAGQLRLNRDVAEISIADAARLVTQPAPDLAARENGKLPPGAAPRRN
ncbi:MAG TPA: efflux RND transporter periplasmic adaptor subunit [Burkholderiaceae bacterium]|nr:efflux RND transporter periplasmic adaptor subunit [Burkholderiaceae bacterium]